MPGSRIAIRAGSPSSKLPTTPRTGTSSPASFPWRRVRCTGILDYLSLHGRPLAFYTEKAACFGQTTRPYTPFVPLEEREAKATESIIRSALKALEIEMILAHSAQVNECAPYCAS